MTNDHQQKTGEPEGALHNNQFLDPPNKLHNRTDEAKQTGKVVAEMPGDDEMRSRLEQQKKNDGYPGSCGIG
ncbi:hypothetical protein H4Q31_12450 [Cohnella lubricantis]|uniref:Uncharacterized protein n=1 Tax=Cohnella lubricantis TaxID=2163172 RepID=A0A841TFV4_9BACL|nr:hypothetical protein [Cohnella lubricantis]MBB6678110.1 hypothetical protein [Cohnella lubricantis]MBP2116717.1 hypothetical protein [Cohnella lubricantis]